MSSEPAYLALMLDAPMQSWGFSSRFQRRTTGLHPTKCGVIGMICAAMGLAKGSPEEKEELTKLVKLTLTTIVIPRKRKNPWSEEERELPVLRLEDFHTVLGTRAASGGIKKDAVITHRQYLLDAKFGVILKGERILLDRIADHLKNPTWGIWFGRKNCIPAEPVCRGIFDTEVAAQRVLVGNAETKSFTTITDAGSFADGNDTWSDAPPVSYDGMRPWPVRRINQQVRESSS